VPPIRDVVGYCPMGCGPHLHVMSGGMIMCLAPGCPDPGAVTQIISDPETCDIVEFTEDDFRVLHPLRERIGGSLFDCPVNRACRDMPEPPRDGTGKIALGRYRAWLDKDGILTLDMLPLLEQPVRAPGKS
jgi:hypothetical protein